jgi:uncharacterized DUF497 family protein
MVRTKEFEWDDAKAASNLRKHKISFRRAQRAFEDLFALVEADFSDESEARYILYGMVDGEIVAVVYTERGERIRIISARKAETHEQRAYYQSQNP